MATAEEQAWPLILLNSPLMGAVSGSFLYTDQGWEDYFGSGRWDETRLGKLTDFVAESKALGMEVGVLIGIVILTQTASLVGKNAALGGRILVWAVMREIGPLFAAIAVISRSRFCLASRPVAGP